MFPFFGSNNYKNPCFFHITYWDWEIPEAIRVFFLLINEVMSFRGWVTCPRSHNSKQQTWASNLDFFESRFSSFCAVVHELESLGILTYRRLNSQNSLLLLFQNGWTSVGGRNTVFVRMSSWSRVGYLPLLLNSFLFIHSRPKISFSFKIFCLQSFFF